MPEWAREHGERAGDRELAEQNDCCAVKLICMIKGSLIATLSCGVLIIRYRIIKGRTAVLLWLDWYPWTFFGGVGCLLPSPPSMKPGSGHTVHGTLALLSHLNTHMYFCFVSYFSPQGWNCTERFEGVRAEEKACLWVCATGESSFFFNNNKWWMFHIRKRCRKSNLVSSFGGKYKKESGVLYHSANLSL